MPRPKRLRATDIERLENTSFAALGAGGAPLIQGDGAGGTWDSCECPIFYCLGPTSCCEALHEWTQDLVPTYGCLTAAAH